MTHAETTINPSRVKRPYLATSLESLIRRVSATLDDADKQINRGYRGAAEESASSTGHALALIEQQAETMTPEQSAAVEASRSRLAILHEALK
jgi:hypothetical protein